MNNKMIVVTMMIFGLTNITACNSDKTDELSKKNQPEEFAQAQPASNVSAMKTSELDANGHIEDAVQQALAAGDYRLFHSKGRRIVVPGFEHLELSLLTSQCGIKPMAKSGDVIKSAEQKLQQKARYGFAKQFNQAIYAKCLAKSEP